MRSMIVVLLLLVLSVAPVWSAAQPEVKVTLSAHRVVKNAQGREIVSSGETAKPGETIEYRAVYKNSGTVSARNLIGTLPVPAEMEYVSATASPATASASTDGVSYSRMPLKRKVRLAGGAVAHREVPVDEYRSLRWDLKDLAPGTSVTVSARMKIKANQKGPVLIKLDSLNTFKAKEDTK
ncbi:MAG: DUF11 domain-containing protein [Desulfuromonadales bacterium]|nr:DUF11 domain-containing protein [Desulfuromonadales bacterium]